MIQPETITAWASRKKDIAENLAAYPDYKEEILACFCVLRLGGYGSVQNPGTFKHTLFRIGVK